MEFSFLHLHLSISPCLISVNIWSVLFLISIPSSSQNYLWIFQVFTFSPQSANCLRIVIFTVQDSFSTEQLYCLVYPIMSYPASFITHWVIQVYFSCRYCWLLLHSTFWCSLYASQEVFVHSWCAALSFDIVSVVQGIVCSYSVTEPWDWLSLILLINSCAPLYNFSSSIVFRYRILCLN